MAKVIKFDLDGVITEDSDTMHEDLCGTYVYRRPRKRAIDAMKVAWERGWTIVIHTGRREEQRRLTENWLYEHGVPYHFLIMQKPYYTFQIDDRVIGTTVDKQLDALMKLID